MVFKLRREASDIPCGIKLRSAGGVSFQSVGPIAAKARFWDREIGTKAQEDHSDRQGAAYERSEQIYSGLDMRSQRYFGAKPCWDCNLEQDLMSNTGRDWEPEQVITLDAHCKIIQSLNNPMIYLLPLK